MKLIKNVNGVWTADLNAVEIHYKSIICPKEDQKINYLRRDMLWELAANKKFIKDFLKICETEIYPDYKIVFAINENVSTIILDITIDKIIEYYTHTHSMKRWQKKAFKELKEYYTYDHISSLLNKKESQPGLTYNGLVRFMLKPYSYIKECVQNNSFNGYDGETFYKIINDSILRNKFISNVIFESLNITDEEKETFNRNYELIKYNFEPNVALEHGFYTSKNEVDSFKLNEELKNSVIKGMPSSFNKFQKAYYIYRRLCQMFSYDEEYFYYAYRLEDFVMPKEPTINHRDINRLNNLTVGDDVICTEITMIYCKFLELLDIPYRITDYYDNTDVDYASPHMKVRFKVDEYIVDADAAHGLTGSDMSYEKSYGGVNFFTINSVIPKRYHDMAKKEMNEVDRFFKNNEIRNEFNDAVMIYQNDFRTKDFVSIEERIRILCDMVSKVDLKFMDILSWVLGLRMQLFDGHDWACKVEFIVNKKPIKESKNYELIILIMYNDEQEVDKDYGKNKYIVINADKRIEKLTYDEVMKRFKNGTYDFTTTSREKKHERWYDYRDEGKNTSGNKK